MLFQNLAVALNQLGWSPIYVLRAIGLGHLLYSKDFKRLQRLCRQVLRNWKGILGLHFCDQMASAMQGWVGASLAASWRVGTAGEGPMANAVH